jgi:hypothetical protein
MRLARLDDRFVADAEQALAVADREADDPVDDAQERRLVGGDAKGRRGAGGVGLLIRGMGASSVARGRGAAEEPSLGGYGQLPPR